MVASRPCAHLFLAKKDMPEMQGSRPYFRSEVLRLLRILDLHLSTSESGYISPHGYSFVDIGWAVYTDHYVQRGIGFELEDFPSVRKWHMAIYGRPAVARAYQKLGIISEA
jgi:GST-like protein